MVAPLAASAVQNAQQERPGHLSARPSLQLLPDGVLNWEALGTNAVCVWRGIAWLRRNGARHSVFGESVALSHNQAPSGNDILGAQGSEGSQYRSINLVVLKKYCGYCEQLDLHANSGVKGLVSQGGIFEGRQVVLSHFGLGDQGLMPVVRLISLNAEVEFLDVSDNNLTDGGVLLLLESIRNKSSLRVLNLSKNAKMSNRSLKPLLLFLLQSRSVVSVGLEGTGLDVVESRVLHLQTCYNRRITGWHSIDGSTEFKFVPSSSAEKVEQYVERFDLLSSGGPCLQPMTTTGQNQSFADVEQLYQQWKRALEEPENVWERNQDFDDAARLLKRWKLECSRVEETERRNAEAAAIAQKLALKQALVSHWGRMARLLIEHRFCFSHEQELAIILGRKHPKTHAEQEFEIGRLKHLISMLETGEGASSVLLQSASRRVAELEESVQRHLKLKRLLKNVPRTMGWILKSRNQMEERIADILQTDYTGMNRSRIQELAAELSDLIDRGETVGVDGTLLAAGQAFVEELLGAITAKRNLLVAAQRVYKNISAWNSIKGRMNDLMTEVQERVHLLEHNIKGVLESCRGWEETFTFDQVVETTGQLQQLLDAAHVRHGDQGMDAALLAEAEQLLHDLATSVTQFEHQGQRAQELQERIAQLLSHVTVGGKRRDSSKSTLVAAIHDVEQVRHAQNHHGLPAFAKTSSAEVRTHWEQAVIQMHDDLISAIEIVDHDQKRYGLNKDEQKKGVGIVHLIPLEITLAKLQKECASDDVESDLALLRRIAQQMQHRFGYASIGDAFLKQGSSKTSEPDPEVEISRDQFMERMMKFGNIEPHVVARLFDLLTPFSFSNFRRLLCSSLVAGNQ